MAWTFTGRKATQTGSGVGSLNVTLNGTAAGSLIVVAASVWNGGGGVTGISVSDNVNGAYTESFRAHDGVQDASLHYYPNNAGGNLTVTVNPAAGTDNYDLWIAVAEFAGGDTASPASGTPATNTRGGGTNTATLSTAGPMTPADNDVLVIAVDGHVTAGTISENAGAEGFTLLDENESGASAEPGGWVYKIISGAPGTPSHSWTIPGSTESACGIAAFKPGVAGDPSPFACSIGM